MDKTLIEQDLSSEQVVGYLNSHRGIRRHLGTIYQFIYRDQATGGTIHQHLRIANKPYRERYGKYDRRGQIFNRVSIDERLKVVNEKLLIGDWEGDTIIGKDCL